jgi:23S rRNA (cytosine1962-C5)-methyltransferase
MATSMPHPRLTLRKEADKRARGAPWVYANDIEMSPALRSLEPGSVVLGCDSTGRHLGLYHFNPHSLIAARLLSRNASREVDVGFFLERLGRALALRQKLFSEPFYRLVHAEGDFLPGLVIDRYGDTLVAQPNTAGMEAALPSILAALDQLLDPSCVIVAGGEAARRLEGLSTDLRVLKGAAPDRVEVRENGFSYACDLVGGQKTGWFYDHRLTRAFMAQAARGARVLDLYSYAGAFGLLALANGAQSALLVDRSETALANARHAAEKGGIVERLATQAAEAFAWAETASEKFDVVIADPPAFAKSRRDVQVAKKGYEKLARLAAMRVAPGGLLCLASCSHHIEPATFLEACLTGVRDASRSASLIHQGGAGPDHPVHPQLPQTAYLKAAVFALD